MENIGVYKTPIFFLILNFSDLYATFSKFLGHISINPLEIMRKLLLFFVGFMILGCSADDTESPNKINNTSFTISNTETVEFKLTENFPIEGGPEITKQAENYSVSQLVWSESGISYLYIPEEGFIGTENVEITYNFHNGAEVYDEEIINLTIEVTE